MNCKLKDTPLGINVLIVITLNELPVKPQATGLVLLKYIIEHVELDWGRTAEGKSTMITELG